MCLKTKQPLSNAVLSSHQFKRFPRQHNSGSIIRAVINESLCLASCGLPRTLCPYQGRFVSALPGKGVSGLRNVNPESLLPSVPLSLLPCSHSWAQGHRFLVCSPVRGPSLTALCPCSIRADMLEQKPGCRH